MQYCTFQHFITHGTGAAQFNTSLARVLENLSHYELKEIDPSSAQYALYHYGVEYLFDSNELCLIQYDISRLQQVYVGAHKVTAYTRYTEMKAYLSQQQIPFSEQICEQQPVLLTAGQVKLYFEPQLCTFVTALKTW